MLRIQDPARSTKEEEVGTALDGIAREGARRMLIEALEEEVADYIERHRGEQDESGHSYVVRNGRPVLGR